jgi:predicted NACHT family NTPase
LQKLARNPLLLTFLCFGFGESGDFPEKRADLYADCVRILLKKWDATRNIEREMVYRKLDVQRREDLLSFVAFQMFMGEERMPKQQRIQKHIADYIQNLGDDNPTPALLRVDSEKVLKSIEAQHGLLVERARGVYSFSHFSLQEYFTARKIDRTNQPTKQRELLEILKREFFNPRWREVFLLTVQLSSNASDLLLAIKKEIDSRSADEQILQNFLQWVQEKSSSVSSPLYKSSAVRAFYYGLVLSCNFDLARKLDSNFDPINCSELELDHALIITLNRTAKPDLPLAPDLSKVLKQLPEGDEFRNQLQRLYNQLPDWHTTARGIRQWRATDDGQLWAKKLRENTINYRNIGQNLDFSDEQKQLLKQYYNSNLLLITCLNTASYVERNIRERIEEKLLLTVQDSE